MIMMEMKKGRAILMESALTMIGIVLLLTATRNVAVVMGADMTNVKKAETSSSSIAFTEKGGEPQFGKLFEPPGLPSEAPTTNDESSSIIDNNTGEKNDGNSSSSSSSSMQPVLFIAVLIPGMVLL